MISNNEFKIQALIGLSECCKMLTFYKEAEIFLKKALEYGN